MDFEDLLSMSLEESEIFLNDFMTSENHLIQAPNYLKKEIKAKCRKTFVCAKRFQLFAYSVKVCAAVAFALILLFSISPTEFTYPYDASYQDSNGKESQIKDAISQAMQESNCWISDMKDSFAEKGNASSDKSQEIIQEIIMNDIDDVEDLASNDISFREDDVTNISNDLADATLDSEHCEPVKSKMQRWFEKIQSWFENHKRSEKKTNTQY